MRSKFATVGCFIALSVLPSLCQLHVPDTAGPSELNTAAADGPMSLDGGPAAEASSTKTVAVDAVSQTASTTTASATTKPAVDYAAPDQWHVTMLPYLWFPGMRGSVGARGYQTSVKASSVDVLSHFRFGLASGVEFRRNRFLVPVDFMWVRLQSDKELPFNQVGADSVTVKLAQVLFATELGYRVIDQEKVKVDAVGGFRYWHIGQTLNFSPGELNLNPSAALNWIDPIVGGHIQLTPAPKVSINLLGDVGGWNTGSKLEYQWVALAGYQIKPRWALLVGYRFLDADYKSNGNLFDVSMPGIFFGATYNFK